MKNLLTVGGGAEETMNKTTNQYFLDDALDWLRAHVTDAPEDAIARSLIKVLDVGEWQGHLEFALDAALQEEGLKAR